MDVPVDRVDAVLTLAAGSPGAAASVDVRGLRARGGWTEWEPGVPTSGAADGPDPQGALPEPVVDVQARLVLTLPTDAGWAMPGPVVRDLTLTAHAATRTSAAAKRDPRRYRVFATREGLVGGDHGERARHRRAGPVRRPALAPGPRAARQQRLHGEGVRPYRPLRVRPGVGRRPVEHPRRLLERREAASSWRDLPPGVPQAQAATAGRLQRRQGPVRADGAQSRRHRPRRRAVLGRARADRQRLGHRRLPVDGRQPAGHGPRRRPGRPAQRTGRGRADRRARRRRGGGAPAVRGGHLAAGRDRPVPAGLGRAPCSSGPGTSRLPGRT